jgi:hypothetical protein
MIHIAMMAFINVDRFATPRLFFYQLDCGFLGFLNSMVANFLLEYDFTGVRVILALPMGRIPSTLLFYILYLTNDEEFIGHCSFHVMTALVPMIVKNILVLLMISLAHTLLYDTPYLLD